MNNSSARVPCTIVTGFLGAILGGLGTEHGIHLLGRYQVLRSDKLLFSRPAFEKLEERLKD